MTKFEVVFWTCHSLLLVTLRNQPFRSIHLGTTIAQKSANDGPLEADEFSKLLQSR